MDAPATMRLAAPPTIPPAGNGSDASPFTAGLGRARDVCVIVICRVRILEVLGREGLFEREESEALTQAYLAYRSAAHQLSLQQHRDTAPADNFAEARAAVSAKWRHLFAPWLDEKVDE